VEEKKPAEASAKAGKEEKGETEKAK